MTLCTIHFRVEELLLVVPCWSVIHLSLWFCTGVWRWLWYSKSIQYICIHLLNTKTHTHTHRLSLRPVHSIWESCRYAISFSFCSSAVLCCCCFLASIKIPITVARLALSPTESTQSLDIKQTWYTKPIQQLFTRSEGNDVLSTSPTPNSNKYP